LRAAGSRRNPHRIQLAFGKSSLGTLGILLVSGNFYMSEKEEERHFGRRNFFREGLREMFKPLADLLAERITNMPDFSSLSHHEEEELVIVRPPGVLVPEEEFLRRCIRCGSCAVACPHNAIELLTRDELSGRSGSYYTWRPPQETGTPRLNAKLSWCRLCEDYPCAAACPTGALSPPAQRPRLGYAALNDETCLRAGGEECRLCVDACPEGERALRIRRKGELLVRPEGCTGCMACEHVCPVDPPAIMVYPPSSPK